MPENQRYIDPNSGAAPQPGGYGASHAPVLADEAGEFDAAVADEVTEEQEKAEQDKPETPKKAAPAKTTASRKG
jgi:hypothetical protein